MAKIKEGEIFPDFEYVTPFTGIKNLKDAVSGKTALVFLRYIGCPLCQYDLHEYGVNYKEITDKGGKLLVVLQSDPEYLATQIKEDSFPYEIICDPTCALYDRFEIEAPERPKEEQPKEPQKPSPKAEKIFAGIKELGYQHGKYEGREAQLPAFFLLDKDMKVLKADYCTSAIDLPNALEIAEML
ncbi:MAG: redoxin domain-containing protein [Eubacteriaceae bacterium]|nr:redoxin domain-containing protein [Eubacteriaceae bacterium]